ncbi:hypothetical protein BGZ73_003169 [Actinomortierella ambigua]|nr:hypothetical protein BGZ73_003169 [Actinomortierella ambigua]
MLPFIILTLTGFVAFQTKPNAQSFEAFITNTPNASSSTAATTGSSDSASSGGSSNWFTRNILRPLTGRPRIPEYTIQDYVFFMVATLKSGAGSYLGAFGQWFVISEIQGTRKSIERSVAGAGGSAAVAGGSDQSNALEAQAEAEKQFAVQAKIKKDYMGAARAYVVAAQKFEQTGTDFNRWQAGTAYEDAYKAFNMAKKTSDAIACLEQAARLFKTSGRQGSKAAGVFNSLGDIVKKDNPGYVANPRRAMEMYKEAAELYKSEGDKRFIQASIRQAEMACLCKEWAIAYDVYQRVVIPESQNEELLRFTIRDHVFNSILCHFGATSGDWVVMRRDIVQGEDAAPDFAGSRGHRLLMALTKAEEQGDVNAYQEACRQYDQLGPLLPWQIELLLSAKRKLDEGDLL